MTETQRSAMQAALGCLVRAEAVHEQPNQDVQEALRAALAEPERPVAECRGWYCAHCQCGVDGSDVTFHEQHTVCGRVITDDRPPPPQAQQPAPVQEPEGWRLVPVQPTAQMTDAALSVDPAHESVWSAYLAAAPRLTTQPPAPPADVPLLTDEEIRGLPGVYEFHKFCEFKTLAAVIREAESAVRQKAGLKLRHTDWSKECT